jgi:hypothetical protein
MEVIRVRARMPAKSGVVDGISDIDGMRTFRK